MPPQGTNSSGQGDLGHGQALSDRTYAGTVQFTRDSHQATTVRPSNAQNLGFDNPYHLAPNRLFGVFSKDPRDVNPYAHRADEIGPTHRIPGIGHLGNLLVPPGWNQGDEPITPLQAQDLYNKARKEAQNILNKTKGDVERLPKDEQERRNEERDWEWNIHFKLDDLLLRERIMMYDQYHERRHIKFQQAKLKVQPQAYSLYPLHTLQPQAVTSIPYYGEPHGPGMLSHQVSFDPPNFQSNDQST